MIKGIGIDIESVKRFEESYKNKNFILSIFTEKEIKYCEKKNEPYISLVGKFCAKEAFIKASDKSFDFKNIEIDSSSGKPKIYLHGNKCKNIYCSIAHTKEYATAIIIIGDK